MLLTNSAEGVTPSGTAATAGNSGGASGNAFDVVQANPGLGTSTLVSDNAHAAHGGLSYKLTIGATADQCYAAWTTSIGSLGASATLYTRVYLYMTANPGAIFKLITAQTGTNVNCGSVIVNTTGTLGAIDTNGTSQGATTNSIPLNQWCRVEFDCTPSATAGVITIRLYSNGDDVTPLETKTVSGMTLTAGPIDQVRFGPRGTAVANIGPFWLDDIGCTDAGPMGPSVTAAGGPAQALPGQTWLRLFRHRQQQLPPAAAVTAAVPAPPGAFPAPPARRGPHRASLGARGALAAGILAAGIGPPAVPAPHQPPAITHPAPHRAAWRSGQGAPSAPLPQPFRPVTVFSRKPHGAGAWRRVAGQPPGAAQQVKVPATVFRRTAHGAMWRSGRGAVPAAAPQPFRPPAIAHPAAHRALWRGIAGTAAVAVQGGGTPQPSRPATVFRRTAHGAAWRGGRGLPPAAQPQPFTPKTVYARAAHRVSWRAGAGPPPAVVQAAGAAQPFRPVTVYARKPHGAIWRAAAGRPPGAAAQPFRPGTVYRRVPHAAAWRAGRGAAPAAQRQPRTPATVFTRLRHGVLWRAGAGSPAAPPPPFTVGTLTASGAPVSVLTAAGASSALTAGTAPGSTLTAGDQRTGGPGG